MTSPQKTALSLLIAVIAFSAFSILAFSGLFDYIETNFYDPRVTQTVERRLGVGVDNADRFHSHNRDRFEAILAEPAFRNVFRVNQSVADINSRDRLVGLLREEMSAFSGLRFVDLARERLWLSTYEQDIVTRTPTSREYSPLSEVDAPVAPGDLGLEEAVSFAYRFEPELNQFIYRFLIYDEFDIARGTALVYVNGHGLSTSLIRAGTLGPGQEVRVVDERSVLLNAMDTHAEESGAVLRELRWNAQQRSAPRPVIELGDQGFVVFRQEAEFGNALWLAPEREFEMSEPMRWTLLGASFVTIFLLGFLLLNLRQDPTVVLSHRVKRFQIDLLREYIENKDQLDWDRWKGEIERRRSDVDKEIKRGLGRLKKQDESEIDALLDKSWEEIFQVIGGSRKQPAIESNVDFGRLEKMIERVVASFQAGQMSPIVSGTAKDDSTHSVPAGAESEESEELEELAEEPEELEESEELEELAEEPEELEESEDTADEFEVVDEPESAWEEAGADLKAELDTVQEDWELGTEEGAVDQHSSVVAGDSVEVEEVSDEDDVDVSETVQSEFPPFGIPNVGDSVHGQEQDTAVDDEHDEALEPLVSPDEGLEVLEEVDDFEDEEATEIEAIEPSFGLIDYGPSLVRRMRTETAGSAPRTSESKTEDERYTEVGSDEELALAAVEEPESVDLDEPTAVEDLDDSESEAMVLDFGDNDKTVAPDASDESDASEESAESAEVEIPEIDDCDILSMRGFLSIVKAAGARVAVRVEDEDGVPRIDLAMYESEVDTEPDIQELVDSIVDSSHRPDSRVHDEDSLVAGIDSLFDIKDLGFDLTEGVRTDEKGSHSYPTAGSSKKRSALLINEDGVLYDLHAAGYRNSDSGMVKSLIAFTRIWRAQFGLLLLPYDDGFHVQHSLGIPGEDTGLFVIPKSSDFAEKVMNRRLVALLRGPLGEHKRLIGFSGEAAFSTGQTLFLPIKFRALSGYALLGLRYDTSSIQAVLERANLDAIQVHTGR